MLVLSVPLCLFVWTVDFVLAACLLVASLCCFPGCSRLIVRSFVFVCVFVVCAHVGFRLQDVTVLELHL